MLESSLSSCFPLFMVPQGAVGTNVSALLGGMACPLEHSLCKYRFCFDWPPTGVLLRQHMHKSYLHAHVYNS